MRIFFPEKAYNNEHITSIINLNNVESLNITDSGKISVNKYSSNRNSKKPKLKFLSQEEINSPENQNNIQNSINNALSKLKDFQNYIERQGWRIRKSKEVEDKEIANLDFSTIKKIRTIKKRYENIRQKLSSMSFYEARKLKNKYSPNSPSKTSRIEFSNPLGDGMNYFFDKSLTRYGEIYKIVKYKDKANVEEKFAITADGKVVKNLSHSALTRISS